jgi:predicted nucleotidyltransferase
MEINEIFKVKSVLNIALFGSRAVGCAQGNSDFDYLVLVKNRPCTKSEWVELGFEPDVQDPLYGEDFSSWRKGNINLVFTENPDYFKVTLEASDFCKKYEVFDKADRCKVHGAFRDQQKRDQQKFPTATTWPF